MHVPTHNFSSIGENIDEIRKRVIDALFHVRDTDGASALLVSVFFPEAQCHLLVELDPDDPHRCQLTVAKQTPEEATVIDSVDARDYDRAVEYLLSILEGFDAERSVSNLVVTTDGRRIQDVTGLIYRPEER